MRRGELIRRASRPNPEGLYTVSKEYILYKCGWSPLEGQRFRSRVTQSIVNGVLTYDNGVFSSESAAMAVKFKR